MGGGDKKQFLESVIYFCMILLLSAQTCAAEKRRQRKKTWHGIEISEKQQKLIEPLTAWTFDASLARRAPI